MPRILLEVNETWNNRFREVMPAAIDTLEGLEHQIQNCLINGTPEAEDLLDQLQSQIIDLRRNLQSVRLMF